MKSIGGSLTEYVGKARNIKRDEEVSQSFLRIAYLEDCIAMNRVKIHDVWSDVEEHRSEWQIYVKKCRKEIREWQKQVRKEEGLCI